MLYDLNVPWKSSQSLPELQRTITFLSTLGYDTLALNHAISAPLPPQIINPIPAPLPVTFPSRTVLLRRCTLSISDPSQNYRLPSLSSAYDILALRPTTEKAFQAACLTLSEHSLISLDLTVRHEFHFRPKPFMTAINRGIRFEICYSQATLGDSQARRYFISNCLGIVRATKGRGLVLSSEARDALGCRGPADVVNMLAIWGLGRERAMEALGVNPRGLVVNEGIKRSAFRGVINVIHGGVMASQNGENAKAGKGKETLNATNGTGKGKGKGKRMAEDGDGDEDSTTPVSKRQAKKLRKEALKAAQESSPSKESSPAQLDPPNSIKAPGNG